MRTALIAGASGLVGGHCLDLLLADNSYRSVTALVRRKLPREHPKLRQEVVEFSALDQHAALFAVDDLFCCLGTTIGVAGSREAFRRVDHDYPVMLARLAKEQGVRQFLIVSSLGANSHSSIFYNRVKGETEDALRALGIGATQIFRPSLLLGSRHEPRLGERIGGAVLKVVAPLLLGRLRNYRPIEAKDVARAMVAVAWEHPAGANIYDSDRIASIARSGGLEPV